MISEILTDPVVWCIILTLLLPPTAYRFRLAWSARSTEGAWEVEPIGDSSALPRVRIVVPAYNEGETIARKIDNTLELNYPRELLEIVIVDDGSEDDTAQRALDELTRRGAQDIATVKRYMHRGPASSLLLGSSNCTASVIVWTDADAIVPANALRTAVAFLRSEEIGAVCSRTAPITSLTYRPRELAERDSIRSMESKVDSVVHSNGTFFAFKSSFASRARSDVLNYDSHMSISIREEGQRAIFAKEITVLHTEDVSRRTQFRRRRRIQLGILVETLHHRRSLFDADLGVYGKWILPYSLLYSSVVPLLVALLTVRLAIQTIVLEPSLFLVLGSLAVALLLIPLNKVPSWLSSLDELLLRPLIAVGLNVTYLEFLLGLGRGSWSYAKGR